MRPSIRKILKNNIKDKSEIWSKMVPLNVMNIKKPGRIKVQISGESLFYVYSELRTLSITPTGSYPGGHSSAKNNPTNVEKEKPKRNCSICHVPLTFHRKFPICRFASVAFYWNQPLAIWFHPPTMGREYFIWFDWGFVGEDVSWHHAK